MSKDASLSVGEPVTETPHYSESSISDEVPKGVRLAAAFSWRFLAIGLGLAGFIWLMSQFALIVVPVLVSLLLTALLRPIVVFASKYRVPKVISTLASVILLIAFLIGIFTFVSRQIAAGSEELLGHISPNVAEIENWLSYGPLHLSSDQITNYTNEIIRQVQQHSSVLLSGAVTVTATTGSVLTGVLLTFFSTIFFLLDGPRIWKWVTSLMPRKARIPIDSAGRAGWVSLSMYVRVQILVAAVNAVGIGLGAWILGLPMVFPIAVVVFFGSFIPFVGAIVTGAVAVIIALLAKGLIIALIMLGIVILVQQLEGHVLQPFIMGKAVSVHPLGVVLAVAAGSMAAGIPGALFAVPLVAVLNTVVHHIANKQWLPTAKNVPAIEGNTTVAGEQAAGANDTDPAGGGAH